MLVKGEGQPWGSRIMQNQRVSVLKSTVDILYQDTGLCSLFERFTDRTESKARTKLHKTRHVPASHVYVARAGKCDFQ